MRVFVALEVPSQVTAVLEAAIAPLRQRYGDLRWARPDGWHVTLAFLGDVGEEDPPRVVDAVDRAVREAGAGRLSLALGDPGHFNRRILWIGVEERPTGAVRQLGRAVQARILAAGLPCDEKPVHPHLTLARTRGRGRLPRAIVDDVPGVEARWEVDRAVVLRSHLGAGGSRYEELAAVALSGS